jgi:GTP-binding protein YchF
MLFRSSQQVRRTLFTGLITQKVPCRGLQTGLVGLPNVGKSCLFNAITNSSVDSANYPFCTIEPTKGYVAMIDPRLEALAVANESVKTLPSVLEFYDIAGLVAGAAEGKGLGNKFLGNIRQCDAIVQVVRCFDDDDIVHVHTSVDPVSDAEVINLELALADLSQASKRHGKVAKLLKMGGKTDPVEVEALGKLLEPLNEGIAVRNVDLSEEEFESIKHLQFLTAKPMIYAANVSDEELATGNTYATNLEQWAATEDNGSKVVLVSAQIESEIAQLPTDAEQAEFLDALGIDEALHNNTGLRKLITEVHGLLQLQTFYTSGPTETKAWTFPKGSAAPQAAGIIHTDFEKKFIKADTCHWQDIVAAGSEKASRNAGKWTVQGKEYIVQDGDVLIFKHNA